MTREAILERIRREGGLDDDEAAVRAARAVVCGLFDRLSGEESEHLRAQLQPDLPELLECGHGAHVPPERSRDRLSEPELVERVREAVDAADAAHARTLVRVVLTAISSRLGGQDEATAGNVASGIGTLAHRPRSRRDDADEE